MFKENGMELRNGRMQTVAKEIKNSIKNIQTKVE
jgi:hypothetical protein